MDYSLEDSIIMDRRAELFSLLRPVPADLVPDFQRLLVVDELLTMVEDLIEATMNTTAVSVPPRPRLLSQLAATVSAKPLLSDRPAPLRAGRVLDDGRVSEDLYKVETFMQRTPLVYKVGGQTNLEITADYCSVLSALQIPKLSKNMSGIALDSRLTLSRARDYIFVAASRAGPGAGAVAAETIPRLESQFHLAEFHDNKMPVPDFGRVVMYSPLVTDIYGSMPESEQRTMETREQILNAINEFQVADCVSQGILIAKISSPESFSEVHGVNVLHIDRMPHRALEELQLYTKHLLSNDD